MNLYRITGWNDHYENNRSRKVIDLSWVPIPNRHDGENFSTIMAHPDGAEIYAAWILMLQVASRCQPRGSLVRDNGKPHTAESLALKTRGKQKWFEKAMAFLSANTDWLEIQQVAPNCHDDATGLPPDCQSGDEEGNRREGNRMEGKGTEEQGADAPVSKFKKPSLDEVKLAGDKGGLPEAEAVKFFNYYESNGWKVGRNPMRSLPHAIANWRVRWEEKRPSRPAEQQQLQEVINVPSL